MAVLSVVPSCVAMLHFRRRPIRLPAPAAAALTLALALLLLAAAAPAARAQSEFALPGEVGRTLGDVLFGAPTDVPDPAAPDDPDAYIRELVIEQRDPRVIIEWDSFSIGRRARVVFDQAHGRQAVALNRVTGSAESRIDGMLLATGQVFIVNPHGIVFGADASVNAAGLVASTLDILDEDFLAGDYVFSRGGADGEITNYGTLSATPGEADGGYVVLLSRRVVNENGGALRAQLGTVAVGAGDQVTLHLLGDGLVQLQIDEGVTGADAPLIVNEAGSEIETDAGLTLLTAAAADDFVGTLISQRGMVRAASTELRDGRIVLAAGGGGDIELAAGAVLAATGDIDIAAGRDVRIAGLITRPRDEDGVLEGTGVIPGNVTLRADAFGAGEGTVIFSGDGLIDLEGRPGDEAETRGDVFILYNPVASGDSHKYMNEGQFGGYVRPGDGGRLHALMLVNDLNDLQDIAENLSGSYALGKDIDASETKDGDPFQPLGGAGSPFTGVLDGRGHVIEGLRVCAGGDCDDPAEGATGLFAVVGAGGEIRSLGLDQVEVLGRGTVGAVAGVNNGTIRRVFVAGSVTAQAQEDDGEWTGGAEAGGVAGRSAGLIEDSYSEALVAARQDAGGLVGVLEAGGRLERTYGTGRVVRTAGDADSFGGLAGRAAGGGAAPAIVNSFWNTDTSQAAVAVGAGLDLVDGEPFAVTTEQMKSAEFWTGVEWAGAAAWNVDTTGQDLAHDSPWRLYDEQTGPLLRDFLTPVVVRLTSKTVVYDGQEHGLDEYTLSVPGLTVGTDLHGTLDFGPQYRNAGTYSVIGGGLYSSGQRGYDIRYRAGELTIRPRPLTIVVEPDQAKIYGEDDPDLPHGFAFDYIVDLVDGDEIGFAGRLYRAPGEDAGTYAITMDKPGEQGGEPDPDRLTVTNPNYIIEGFESSDFVIKPRPVAIELEQFEHYKTYGETYELGGLGEQRGWKFVVDPDRGWYDVLAGDAFTGELLSGGTSATANVVRGQDGEPGWYEITLGTLRHPNYEIVHFGGGRLYVQPAPLTVRVKDYQRIYGNYAPQPDVEYEGLVLGQTGIVWTRLEFGGVPGQFAPVGTYEVSVDGETNNINYDITFQTGTLEIVPRPISVTVVSPADKEYGEAIDPETIQLIIAYDGPDDAEEALVNGDELSGMIASAGFAANAPVLRSGETILAYAIEQGTLGVNDTNYQIRFVEGQFRVLPARLTVAAQPDERPYGDPNPELKVTYSGFKLGENAGVLQGQLVFDGVPGVTDPAGQYTVTPGGLWSGNYDIDFVSAIFTVTRRPIVVRLETPEWEKVYGETIDPQDVKWVVDPGALVGGDTLQGQVHSDGFAADADVLLDEDGLLVPYVIGAGSITNENNPNYDITFIPGTLLIKQAQLIVTAQANSRIYGSETPAAPYSVVYEGFRAGDDHTVLDGTLQFITPPAGTPVGVYEDGIMPAGLRSSNYTITFRPGALTIQKRPIEVSLVNPFLTKEYGETFDPRNARWYVSNGSLFGDDTLDGAPHSDGFAADAPVRDDDGNVIVYKVERGTLDNPNYDITFVEGTLTLNPAPLEVIVGDVTRYYGDPNPEIPVTYVGFKLGEDESVLEGELFLSTVGPSADVLLGGYPITPGGLSARNYSIRYVRGTLTILPAPLKARVKDAWRYYGDPNPQFEMEYEGFKLGQDETVLSGRLQVDAPGITAPVKEGGYVTTPSGLRSGNYEIEFIPGTLEIRPAPLTIRALDTARRYGSPNPAFSAAYEGLKLGETPAALEGQLRIDTTADRYSAPGRYVLAPSGKISPNYDITYVNGTLTVYVSPGDVEWPRDLRRAFDAVQGVLNAVTSFGGVDLSCVDPAADAREVALCPAFGRP